MHQHLATLELKALEEMYLKEVEILKLKLLNGAYRKDVRKQKNKAVLLATIIHEKQYVGSPSLCEHFLIDE